MVLAISVLALGLWPAPLVDMMSVSIESLLSQISNSKIPGAFLMTILNELTLASGEITLLALLCLVLVIDLFVSQEKRIITYWLTMATLAATAFMVAFNSPESGSLIFSGSYVSDELSVLLKLVSIVSTAVVILYSRDYLIDNDLFKGEFFILILFGLLGIMIMISANFMLVMYLGLETLALSLYALVALDSEFIHCR